MHKTKYRWQNTKIRYKYIILFILILSTIKEFVQLPGLEINQLCIILIAPLIFPYLCTLKKNHLVHLLSILLFILACFIIIQGLLMAIDLSNTIRTLKNYIIAFIFIYFNIHQDWDDYKYVLYHFVTFCNILFFIEFTLSYFDLSFIYNLFFLTPYGGIRNLANFLSPNSYGIIISFLIIINLHIFLTKKSWLHLSMFFFLPLPIWTTASKSSLFILIIGFSVYTFTRVNIIAKLFIIFSYVFIAFFPFYFDLYTLLTSYEQSYMVRRILLYLEHGSILGDRTIEYIKIFEIYKSNWFLGLGFGNISGDNALYQGMSSMHNEYLRFFVEGGIIGGILFSVFLSFLIYSIVKIYTEKSADSDITFVITIVTMFLVSEIQYNFFNAPREGIVLSFLSCASVCWMNQKRRTVHRLINIIERQDT